MNELNVEGISGNSTSNLIRIYPAQKLYPSVLNETRNEARTIANTVLENCLVVTIFTVIVMSTFRTFIALELNHLTAVMIQKKTTFD